MQTNKKCSGWIKAQYSDIEWAHGMFVCDEDCPLELEVEIRHKEALRADLEAIRSFDRFMSNYK